MKNFLLSSLLLFPVLQFAQLENHTWYFSPTTRGIRFDPLTAVPSVVIGHAPLSNLHGCGVASDPTTGNVFFYTDGASVFDDLNLVMPNGSGLICGTSCAQKGQLLLVPGSCTRYYVFTNTSDDPTGGNLYYSIVNRSLPGNGSASSPKGDVETTGKNILLASGTTEAMTIAPNPNGNFWLLVPSNASSNIRVFSVTSSGITLSGTYSTGISIAGSFAIKYSAAAGKVAYISVVENQPALLMDFDPVTGVLSGAMTIPGTPLGTNTSHFYGMHDVEFSPDGTKLYLSKYRMFSPVASGRIYQYDLNSPASPVTAVFSIPSTDVSKTCTGLKTGPDGKIYFIYFNVTYSDDRLIGAINFPNAAGAACGVNASALDLGIAQGNNSRFPETVDYFNGISVNATNASSSLTISCQVNQGSLTLANPSAPLNLSIVDVAHGSALLTTLDSISYTSAVGYTGMDTIRYLACDTACFALCDTGYIYLTINPHGVSVNAGSDSGSVDVNCQLNYAAGTFANPSDPYPVSFIDALHGTVSLGALDSIEYTSTIGYVGVDTISYSICDTVCTSICDTSYIYVSVNPCMTTFIGSNRESMDIVIYPNPSTGSFEILVQNGEGLDAVILNILGERVLQLKLQQGINPVDLHTFGNGLYLLKVRTSENEVSKRIVIEN